jgi:hypothetical protein
LTSYPTTHVDIAVRRSGTVRVDVETDARLAFLAVTAAATRDVERYRAEVAELDELHVGSGFDDLPQYLVAEHEARGRRRAAAHHVLIASTYVRRDDFQNHAVVAFASDVRWIHPRPVLELEFRIGDVVDLDLARLDVGHCPVA